MSKYNPEDLLTTDQLAEHWGCAKSSLEQQRYNKCGPPYIKAVGVGLRYKFQDILDYEEDHKVGG